MFPVRLEQRSALTRVWSSPTLNTWASLATRSLNLVVLIPFILRQFSPAEIALWYLFSTIVTLNLMIDLGMGATFTRFIAYAMGGATGIGPANRTQTGDPNREYLQRVVGTQQTLFNWMSLLVFLLLATVGTWTLLRPMAQLDNPREGWVAWVMVIIGTTVGFRGNAYAVYLQGINRIAEFRRYETFFSLASIVCSSLVLLLDAGLLTLVAVNQFWVVASAVRNRFLCIRYNEGGFGPGEHPTFDPTILREIWPSAWRSGVGVLMSYGLIQSSSLIYAQDSHVAQVSSYLFAMRVMQLILTFAQAPFYSKLPLLSRLYAQGDHSKIIRLAQQGMMRAHWTFVAGVAGVALLANPLMHVIGSQISFVEPKLWALMSLAFFIERYGAMHLQLYSISNKIVWHIANGITGIIYILACLLFYPKISVYAFPLSIALSYSLFYSWYSAKHSYKYFRMKFWKFEQQAAGIPFLIFGFVFIFVLFLNEHQ